MILFPSCFFTCSIIEILMLGPSQLSEACGVNVGWPQNEITKKLQAKFTSGHFFSMPYNKRPFKGWVAHPSNTRSSIHIEILRQAGPILPL